MHRSIASIVLVAAVLLSTQPAFARSDPSIDAPPADIVPTQTTLGSVLRAHSAAITPSSATMSQQSREVWLLDEAGRSGTETILRRGDDYHSILERSGAHEEYGKLGSEAWHLDANGVVTPTIDEDEDSFNMQRVLEDASDPKNDVKLLGTIATPAAFVVEVDRPGAEHPEWIFFDQKTGYVVRTERIIDGERVASTYDDYRTGTDGTVRPWHVADAFMSSAVTYAYRLTTRIVGEPVVDDAFRAPTSAFHPGTVSATEHLHSTVAGSAAVVRVVVAGRGLDFELSGGSKRSYIDRKLALALGLPTFGQATKTAKGAPLGFDTILDTATVGSMTLHGFALRAVDIAYDPSEDVKVVGVLGSDFLNSGLFTIDYANKNVSVEPLAAAPFAASSDVTEMPVSFDDGVPNVPAMIGRHFTTHARVDNAFPITAVMGSFTKRYPEVVPDQYGKTHAFGNLPFADNKTYGRDADIWLSTVPAFAFAALRLNAVRVVGTDLNLDDSTDIVIGYDFLQYFDVQFDYAHGRIVLRKNRFFFAQFHPS